MQPLDQISRFDPPAFAPGEEQRLADHERRLADQDAKITQVLHKYCEGYTDSDWIQLAYGAFSQLRWVDPRIRELGFRLLELASKDRDDA